MTTNAPKATAATPRRFYVAMSLTMLVLVTYGFSHTIGPGLLHTQRPVRDVILLSVHGAVFFAWMLFSFGLGHLAILGVAITGLALLYEHTLVKANDLSRLNAAFFTTNGFISMLILFAITADRIIQSHHG